MQRRNQCAYPEDALSLSKCLLLFLCLGWSAFAGQSIQLGDGTVSNASIPAQPPGNSWRIEFSIHDWATTGWTGDDHALDGSAVGANIQFLNLGNGDIRLQIYSSSTSGGAVCQIGGLGPSGPGGGGSIYTTRFLTVRYQEDAAAKFDHCQAWDIQGNLVWNVSSQYTSNSGSNANGAAVGGLSAGANLDTAYFRIYTSTVSNNARPPVTADTLSNCLVFWKFDQGNNTGSLNDSCPAGPYNANVSTDFPVYVPTPGQGLVVAVPGTMNAPVWNTWATLRAGFPNQLDGTASYSQADGSASVSCFWQFPAGPSTLTWDNQASCTPTVQGLVFGDYQFQLLATDVNGVQVTSVQDIGAVAMDSNGVVINADPNVDALFGPMIAFGYNPWGFQDYWALHASQLRLADYLSDGWIQGPSKQPQWEYTGQGATSYYFNCVGYEYFCNQGQYSGTLSGACAVGATACVVSTVLGLDLSAFPTHLILYDGSSAEVRICSNSGTTLNICYDGWGQAAAHTFNAGTPVLQSKVTGTNTKFLTDATAPVCPVGAPGPPGPSLYSTGTVALAAGSATMTGSGTAWIGSGAGSMVGDYVRVPSTHGGTPFVFVAQITAASASSITLNRAFPSDADNSVGLPYNIMLANRTIVLRYPHAVDSSGLGELMFGTSGGCESETAVYTNPISFGNSFAGGHDVLNADGLYVSGTAYSVTDTTGWVNESAAGGISFYGESLAHRALYYRSGLTSALTAANYISDYWMKSPWGNADGNGYPRLFLGGEGIGSFVAGILTGRVAWPDLRGYGAIGLQMVNGFAANGCNSYDDTRDSGYAYTFLILAAIYDPDTTSTNAPGGIPWRTYWQNNLAQMKTNDTNCQNQTPSSGNSFANGFLWNASFPALTMTNGSATATGTGLTPSMCNGAASGTATLTSGSNSITVLTGTIPTGTTALFLTGTTGGGASSFVQHLAYGSSGILGANWFGDTATVNWISENIDGNPSDGQPQDMLVIASGNDDLTGLQKSWACTWNSSTTITLNRPWDGASSDGSHVYHPYSGNLAGYGQQAFMLGIKSYGENLLASQTLPELASYVAPYKAFTANSTAWIWNNGMDHQLLGTNYGRIFQQCEPANAAPNGTAFTFRAAGCTYGADPATVYLSREQNAETSAAHGIFYQIEPRQARIGLADQFYGALWGYCPWTTGGAFCDANSTAANAAASNLADSYIHAGKWLGFFTGIGMSHRWPAVRLGNRAQPSPRSVLIAPSMSDVPLAVSATVRVTSPSGAETGFPCSSDSCTVTVDDRQGAHWYRIQYFSSTGQLLRTSGPELVAGR